MYVQTNFANQDKEILSLNTFKGTIFAVQNFRRLDWNRPYYISINPLMVNFLKKCCFLTAMTLNWP